ncbi:hypothetical protein [Pseudomonas solani]|uniref:hypothetical protein n=1 Tax=Pseudomonas solani TaxID=2731552 RepID=UPI003D6AB74D
MNKEQREKLASDLLAEAEHRRGRVVDLLRNAAAALSPPPATQKQEEQPVVVGQLALDEPFDGTEGLEIGEWEFVPERAVVESMLAVSTGEMVPLMTVAQHEHIAGWLKAELEHGNLKLQEDLEFRQELIRQRDDARAALSVEPVAAALTAVSSWTEETRAAVLEFLQNELNEGCNYQWFEDAIGQLHTLVQSKGAVASTSKGEREAFEATNYDHSKGLNMAAAIDQGARWVDEYGAPYRLCPAVGNLQILVVDYGRPAHWADAKMTPAHALTHLSPLSAPPAAGVPEGFVLAPIKPSIEMVEAGYEESLGQPDRSAHARVIEQYEAMLAEAPTPPASEQQQAVVLPERRTEYVGDRDNLQWARGANFMLDEFLRLNPHLQLAAPSQGGDL